MKERKHMNIERPKSNFQLSMANERGAVLITSLFILLLLMLVGKAAITSSITEKGIAANNHYYKKTFYTAEAGLEQAKQILQTEFTHRNQGRIASGQAPDWDFALNGIVPNVAPATGTNDQGGAVWIIDRALEDGSGLTCRYTVTVWNNPKDKGGITDDTDQLLCIRSVATGPRGTRSSIQALLRGQGTGEPIAGYFAQAGGTQNSRDVRAISNFSVQ